MFDSWGELLIIAVVALVVVGPKELPQLLRTLGQWVGKARRMAGDFQSQVNEAIREAELDDVRKSVDDLRSLSPKNLIASQLASVTSDLARVESDVAAKPVEAVAPVDAEPAMAGVDAERLIDTAGAQLDLPMPLTPNDMVETPIAPYPVAAADAEPPKKEPSA